MTAESENHHHHHHAGRHICFRYNATSSDIVDNSIEQLDLENMGVVVGILFVGVLEIEITLG